MVSIKNGIIHMITNLMPWTAESIVVCPYGKIGYAQFLKNNLYHKIFIKYDIGGKQKGKASSGFALFCYFIIF